MDSKMRTILMNDIGQIIDNIDVDYTSLPKNYYYIEKKTYVKSIHTKDYVISSSRLLDEKDFDRKLFLFFSDINVNRATKSAVKSILSRDHMRIRIPFTKKLKIKYGVMKGNVIAHIGNITELNEKPLDQNKIEKPALNKWCIIQGNKMDNEVNVLLLRKAHIIHLTGLPNKHTYDPNPLTNVKKIMAAEKIKSFIIQKVFHKCVDVVNDFNKMCIYMSTYV